MSVAIMCGCGHTQHYGGCSFGADSTAPCPCLLQPIPLDVTFAAAPCLSCAALRARVEEFEKAANDVLVSLGTKSGSIFAGYCKGRGVGRTRYDAVERLRCVLAGGKP